uniref:Uncharacterized protein n=1 Tax=Hanusia phi TaxID=3032 RepID=A0A6T7N8U6_9CRYP|mmetsp:Transcript_16401/g.37447  ORF Transcript_16401/g.37447 Transcript_16401/m.37447 type:complete len:117 (+) Transcript_16401:206-556(+)
MPKISNLNSPTNIWSQGCIPYSTPAHGIVETEKFVDLKAAKGSRVKIAQAWVCHYPTLSKVVGTLTKQVGNGWAVLFDGENSELFFDVRNDMMQLVHVDPQAPGDSQDVNQSLEST